MKVFTKILGAVLLLGCLAYISFVFGKYVLSSTLLKSIPTSQRIINTDAPAPKRAPTPASSSGEQASSPQVKMRVMPNDRPSRRRSVDTNKRADSPRDVSDSDDANETRKKRKKFDEEELSSTRRKRSHRRRKTKKTEKKVEVKKSTPKTEVKKKAPKKKPAPSNPAPIRRMNKVEKTEKSSPVPRAEKSTSTPSNSGDAASISPVPKPE